MKPERAFVAERVAAQHCAELLRRGPEPADLLPQLERLGDRLGSALIPALAPLCGEAPLSCTVLPPRETHETELGEALGALAATVLLSTGVPGVSLLAALDGGAALALVDRAFGGPGNAPAPLPAAFPMSAQLMIERLERMIAAALAAALGHGDDQLVQPLRRASRFADLGAYPAGMRLVALTLELRQDAAAPWSLTLALPLALLPKVLGPGESAAAPRGQANPAAAPFAGLPLPLSAVLVDMAVPLHTLSTLAVGSLLPVAVARAVPIRVGDAVIARGSVGAQDDRIAVRLTQIAG
ncbi:MAG: FliM/FliN family flagellar motor C-terminal domain-containing protein [Novosphingobium sp.]